MITVKRAVSSQLTGPRRRLKVFGDRAFSNAAPRLWNALPGSITECKSIGAFNKCLKTNLFKSAFNCMKFMFLYWINVILYYYYKCITPYFVSVMKEVARREPIGAVELARLIVEHVAQLSQPVYRNEVRAILPKYKDKPFCGRKDHLS